MRRSFVICSLSLVLLCLLLCLSGCPDLGERYAEQELWLAEPVAWAEVEPVFKRRCAGCHGELPAGGASFSLTTYDEVRRYAERVRVRVLINLDMPPGGLQQAEERDVIARWLALGAPELIAGAEAGQESGEVAGQTNNPLSWREMKPLFDIYCNTCHALVPTGGASFGLTRYADVELRREAIYERVVVRGDMPPGGVRDEADLASFEAWLSAGAPE